MFVVGPEARWTEGNAQGRGGRVSFLARYSLIRSRL